MNARVRSVLCPGRDGEERRDRRCAEMCKGTRTTHDSPTRTRVPARPTRSCIQHHVEEVADLEARLVERAGVGRRRTTRSDDAQVAAKVLSAVRRVQRRESHARPILPRRVVCLSQQVRQLAERRIPPRVQVCLDRARLFADDGDAAARRRRTQSSVRLGATPHDRRTRVSEMNRSRATTYAPEPLGWTKTRSRKGVVCDSTTDDAQVRAVPSRALPPLSPPSSPQSAEPKSHLRSVDMEWARARPGRHEGRGGRRVATPKPRGPASSLPKSRNKVIPFTQSHPRLRAHAQLDSRTQIPPSSTELRPSFHGALRGDFSGRPSSAPFSSTHRDALVDADDASERSPMSVLEPGPEPSPDPAPPAAPPPDARPAPPDPPHFRSEKSGHGLDLITISFVRPTTRSHLSSMR